MVATGQAVAIHPSSVLCGKRAECVVFNELVSAGTPALPWPGSAVQWARAWSCPGARSRLPAPRGRPPPPPRPSATRPPAPAQVRTTRQYARDATVIEPSWLPELAPAYFARQHANQR